ncbi:hypothetical protein, partial [Bacillus mycoides]|uniref:hypothetical protein n=1 Tax=Bacillus mycoides TaxID=1405 RepID=UPI003A7FC4F7
IKKACEDASGNLEGVGKSLQSGMSNCLGITSGVEMELREKLGRKESFVIPDTHREHVMNLLADKGVAYPHIVGGARLAPVGGTMYDLRRRMYPIFKKHEKEFEWLLVDTPDKTFVWHIDTELGSKKRDWSVFLGVLVTFFACMCGGLGLIWLLSFLGKVVSEYLDKLG